LLKKYKPLWKNKINRVNWRLKMCIAAMFVLGWFLGTGTTIGLYFLTKKEIKNG